MTTLKFDTTTIEIFDNSTRITLENGATILGAPEQTSAYLATTEWCGYDTDTTALCKEHELLHVALNHWLSVNSPTLQGVAANNEDEMQLRWLEENAILHLQRYCRARNIDLIKLFEQRQNEKAIR